MYHTSSRDGVKLWVWNEGVKKESPQTKHVATGGDGIQPHEIKALSTFLGEQRKQITNLIITTGVADWLKVSPQTIKYLGEHFNKVFQGIVIVWIVPTTQGVELYNWLVYRKYSVAALLHKTC